MTIFPTLFGVLGKARRPKSRLNAICCLGLGCLVASFIPSTCATAQTAQEVPRLQIFGGYSYLHFDSKTFGFASGSNLNGWNGSVAWNINRNFGGIAELSGQYNSQLNLRDFAVGPQFLLPRGNKIFFAHVLFGKGRTFINEGGGVGDTQRAYVAGGGVDFSFRHRLDIRVVQADFVRTELLEHTQDNFRISTGIVYRWGGIRRVKHRPPNTQAP